MLELLLRLFFDGGAGVPGHIRSDRRRLRGGRVLCGLRAAEGRVHNIGTEWSTGVAELSPHHLRFIPGTGIVGEREIDITDLRVAELDEIRSIALPSDPSTIFAVSTNSGDLLWAVPDHIADEIFAQVAAV